MGLRRALAAGALAAAAAALLAVLALAGDEPRPGAPAARTLSLRPLMPPGARRVRDPAHALRVSVPPGWRRGREGLLPGLALEQSSILAVATFDPRAEPRRACGDWHDMPQVAIGPRETLLHVEEQLEAQPGSKPRRPRTFRLDDPARLPWRCLERQGVVGLRASFRAHGRLLHVRVVAGTRTGTRRRRVLLGVLRSLRFGPVPDVPVRVHPATGRQGTRFRLELVSTHPSGGRGRRERGYWAAVHGPLRSACVIENEAWFSHGPAGTRLRAVLDPTRTKGQSWCRGHFRGVLRYRDGICDRRGPCDRMYTRRAGHFRFTVR